MNIRMMARAALGAVLALSVSAVSAAAHLIVYSMAGVGTGTVHNTDGSTSSFSDTGFDIRIDGLTQFAGPCGGGCHYVFFYAGSVSANGQTHALAINPANVPLFLIVPQTGFQVGVFGTDPAGTFNQDAGFATPALGGYDGTTNIGPVPIFWFQRPVLTLTDGTEVDFSSITNATFSAAVPEPGTWAMMLVGVGGLGASLRARRKAVSAA